MNTVYRHVSFISPCTERLPPKKEALAPKSTALSLAKVCSWSHGQKKASLGKFCGQMRHRLSTLNTMTRGTEEHYQILVGKSHYLRLASRKNLNFFFNEVKVLTQRII